jgi:hypothetical protein
MNHITLRIPHGVAVVLAALLSLGSICLAADKKQLTAAVAEVDANLKTSAGKQYDNRLGKEFPEKYWSSVKQCKQSLPAGTNLEPFDMFLKLNAEGKVQVVLVYPETQFANCTREALQKGKFSNPPHDDYWINIHLELKH